MKYIVIFLEMDEYEILEAKDDLAVVEMATANDRNLDYGRRGCVVYELGREVARNRDLSRQPNEHGEELGDIDRKDLLKSVAHE